MADVRCSEACNRCVGGSSGDETLERQVKMNEALRLFKEAVDEVHLWSELSSRRIVQMMASALEIDAMA